MNIGKQKYDSIPIPEALDEVIACSIRARRGQSACMR